MYLYDILQALRTGDRLDTPLLILIVGLEFATQLALVESTSSDNAVLLTRFDPEKNECSRQALS